jgi:hypothetical protein
MTNTVADCEVKLRQDRETLADLLSRRAKIDSDAVVLTELRESCAFDAHSGNSAARNHLNQVNKQFIQLRLDEQSLDAAVVEAHLRVSLAEERRPGDAGEEGELPGDRRLRNDPGERRVHRDFDEVAGLLLADRQHAVADVLAAHAHDVAASLTRVESNSAIAELSPNFGDGLKDQAAA